MRITARCHPKLRDLLPEPVAASGALPDWLRAMPSTTHSPTLGGEKIRTLKHCPPFLDAMGLGLVVPLPTDVTIEAGEVFWDWDFPVIDDAPITRSPIGVHVPEQLEGAPFEPGDRLLMKFNTFWTFETEPGWSLLFTHPFNRPDLPFATLTGLVDTDRFSHGYVHFPVLLDPAFEGTIARGTPVAQIVPVRRGSGALIIEMMSDADIRCSSDTQRAVAENPGAYRKGFRRK